MNRFKKVMLTTDLSTASCAAIDPAVVLAKTFRAKLLLVYVGEQAPLPVHYPGMDTTPSEEHQLERAENDLEEFARVNLPSGIDYEPIVGLGVPHLEIVRIAEEQSADLIVMATRGRGSLSRALMGSTTERVVHLALCPVLAVGEHVVREAVRSYELTASRRSGRAPGARSL